MSSSPLYVAFLWHMHQPYYRDPFTGIYRLPWVRLHGTKDYLDMVEILDDYPEIKQTFNLVPSLIEQLKDYTDKAAIDAFLEATIKRPSDLTEEERTFILENFFLANWDNLIKAFPRYYELLLKRGLTFTKNDLKRISRYFSDGDFLDLQVLFNLVWIDPMLRSKDKFLKGLAEKGTGFTEDEKKVLIEKQLSILKKIVPKYKKLASREQIEISTTPFYHPILPLLADTDMGRVSSPDIRLPKRRFSHPEDAEKQIDLAISYFENIFGNRPAGMWPSEGSVSEDIVRLIHSKGIKWLGTDEEILARSLNTTLRGSSGNLTDPTLLYSAHEFSEVSLVFRDHKISDLIGFVYSGWEAEKAADDLINRLLAIRNSLPQDVPHVVPIILDGENAWEYYKNDGHDFFKHLYEKLSNNEMIKTTTISEYLNISGDRKKLERLHPGSWISANYNVWIGHPEDNTAWDYLTEAREYLGAFQKANPEKNLDPAWKALYIAEGSDWNWWYGDEHSTDTAEVFDELFRSNLMKIYKETGADVPPQLYNPIITQDRLLAPSLEIRGFINPKIDGIMTSYFEWYQGAYIEVGRSGGSMHMTEGLLSRVYYGFNQGSLFLRLDPKGSFSDFPEDCAIVINIAGPFTFRLNIRLKDLARASLLIREEEQWTTVKDIPGIAVGDILECAITFEDIKAKEDDALNIFISLNKENEELERCPWRGYITVTVPTPEFEAIMWS